MATPKPGPVQIASRNPIPLSSSQETQVRELYYKRVRGYCADEIRDFASCALNRTFSATWVCRQQRLAMNNCMISHASQQEQDAAREEWFATRDERRKEREVKEAKRKEQEKFHRAWWGMPPLPEDEDTSAATGEKR
ncbi:MAG: hypothetical protein Q9209_004814 [Squamulea sp. 1 TL-2023]